MSFAKSLMAVAVLFGNALASVKDSLFRQGYKKSQTELARVSQTYTVGGRKGGDTKRNNKPCGLSKPAQKATEGVLTMSHPPGEIGRKVASRAIGRRYCHGRVTNYGAYSRHDFYV